MAGGGWRADGDKALLILCLDAVSGDLDRV
jgi:hypothetical protein